MLPQNNFAAINLAGGRSFAPELLKMNAFVNKRRSIDWCLVAEAYISNTFWSPSLKISKIGEIPCKI